MVCFGQDDKSFFFYKYQIFSQLPIDENVGLLKVHRLRCNGQNSSQ